MCVGGGGEGGEEVGEGKVYEERFFFSFYWRDDVG